MTADAVATDADAAGADANANPGNTGDSRRKGKATVELVETALEQADKQGKGATGQEGGEATE